MSQVLPLASEFLDIELFSRLSSLELQAKYLVNGFLSGLHKSPFQGSSVEFKEFRDYQPGDELKLIDWKVYARTDRLHVRLREEETNMTVYLLVDSSASMNYKGPKAVMSKWDYARALAAAFLIFLSRQRDSAALGFLGAELEDFVRGRSSPAHYHQLMGKLHRNADSPISRLAEAMRPLPNLVRRRSIVIVFSDFYESAEKLESSVSFLQHLNCEVIFFHIMDPSELDFDFDYPIRMQELETGESITINPDALRDDYLKNMKKHTASISEMLMGLGGDYLLLRTDEVPTRALGEYLAKRSAMS